MRKVRFEFMWHFLNRHVHIAVEIIIQCRQHCKTTIKDGNSSDYIQWQDGKNGD